MFVHIYIGSISMLVCAIATSFICIFTISHGCIFLRNEEADVLKEEDWGRTFIANYEVIIHISSIGIEITGTCVIQIMGKLSSIIMIDYR